jgi:pimeloyl-ACP methyl ester carboxylesterase
VPTRTEHTHQVTTVEVTVEISHANFTRAFESLLGRMPVEVFSALPSLSPQAARERLASYVGPLDFILFQKIDHGAIVTALTGRRCEATTYVFGNALIAIEMTKHVARAGLYVPLRLFVEAITGDRVRVTYDLPSSLMAPLGSADVNTVARGLDAKVERFLDETSQLGGQGRESRGPSSPSTLAGAETAVSARTGMSAVGDRLFAYRSVGTGTPIIFLQRFRGTMDDWDPAFVDAVATSHRVILFDNAGVSSSTGEVALTLGSAADDAVAFARNLGIDQAAVLGWSMGGLIAQEVAMRCRDFARQVIVIGAVPPGPTPVPTQQVFATTARKPVYDFEDQVTLFFTQSEASRKAAQRSLDRIAKRTVDREPAVSVAAYTNQTAAIKGFHEDRDALAKLEASDVPILVLNGNQDIANPVENWYALGAKARFVEIHVFPDAAHGSHHQFPERAAETIKNFIRAHGG